VVVQRGAETQYSHVFLSYSLSRLGGTRQISSGASPVCGFWLVDRGARPCAKPQSATNPPHMPRLALCRPCVHEPYGFLASNKIDTSRHVVRNRTAPHTPRQLPQLTTEPFHTHPSPVTSLFDPWYHACCSGRVTGVSCLVCCSETPGTTGPRWQFRTSCRHAITPPRHHAAATTPCLGCHMQPRRNAHAIISPAR
jgi:hypothetical protein